MECTTKITITTTIKTTNKKLKKNFILKDVRIADAFSFFVKSLRQEIAIQSCSSPRKFRAAEAASLPKIFLAIVSCLALLWTKRSISKELAAPRAKETKYR